MPIADCESVIGISEISCQLHNTYKVFLQSLCDDPRHAVLLDHIKRFVKGLLKEESEGQVKKSINGIIASYQTFLRFANARMRATMVNTSNDNEAQSGAHAPCICIERLICTELYEECLFSPRCTNDAQVDLFFWCKITKYAKWIRLEHLLDKGGRNVTVSTDSVCEAQKLLHTITEHRNPVDKVSLISRVCKSLDCESADDLLPLLIYMIIQSNPPFLHSNAQFILRFWNTWSRQSRNNGDITLEPEKEYYLTTFIAALGFIEQMDRTSLGLTVDQNEDNQLIDEIFKPEENEEKINFYDSSTAIRTAKDLVDLVKSTASRSLGSLRRFISQSVGDELIGKGLENLEDEETDDEEFKRQLDMAIKLSLGE